MLHFVIDIIVFTILSLAWFFLPPFELSKRAQMVVPVQSLQEIKGKKEDYVENQLLKAKRYTINDNIYFDSENQFVIDGAVFKEKIKVERLFREFEVYSYKFKMEDYADTSGVSIDDDAHLQLALQPVPNGIIINSNVYLTYQQWNTLYSVSEESLRCAVCDMPSDVTEHVTTTIHRANMERYTPLHKYDLSITRKINNNYHCGVCNELFEQAFKDEHFSSKQHEDKMLFAINKVSDIMYDLNIHTNNNIDDKKPYHFDSKAIYNNNIEISSDEYESDQNEDHCDYNDNYNDNWNFFNALQYENCDDEYFYEEPAPNSAHSYASMARKPKGDDLPEVLEIDLGNKKATVKFDSWNMVNRTRKRNLFYCMACKKYDHVRLKAEHCNGEAHVDRLKSIPLVDTFDNYLVRQVTDKLYHCGHCNNLQLIHEMADHLQSEHPASNQTHFFDTPVKKPSTPVKSSKINNNHEVKKVNKAIISNGNTHAENIDTNINDDPRNVQAGQKNDKQNDASHNRFNDDAMIQDGNDYTNLYNNDYISNDAAGKMNDSDQAFNSCKGVDRVDKNLIPLLNTKGMYDGLKDANENFDDIIIVAHDNKIRISKIAFNVVCQGQNDFYCGLCEVNVSMDNLKAHLNDLQHLALLQATPFIEAFNIHLFREIRDALHCALCNELIQIVPDIIMKHKILEKHIVKFNRAVEPIASENEVAKSAINTKNAAKNDLNTKTGTAEVAKIPTIVNGVVTNKPEVANKKESQNTSKNLIPNLPQSPNKKESAIRNNNVAIANKNLTIANEEQKITLATAILDNENDRNIDVLPSMENAKQQNVEFVVVKNGIKDEIEEDFDESFTDDFDFEEYVYVKLGNNYIKITNTAYNTLVCVGDGSRYCFVCACVVDMDVQSHVDSRGHIDCMQKFNFVDKYNEDLLRQYYLMYHCSVCNVVVTRKQLNHHLSWPTHTLQRDNTKISSKKRKNEIKSGTKQITVNVEKENIYLNEKETDIKIYLNIGIEKESFQVEMKNKIVIFNDMVLKVDFDCWHSLSEAGTGYRCKMCQCEFEEKEFGAHVSSDWHKAHLDKIEKQYAPALIRKINDTTLNCVMCNTEVSNKKSIVTEHIQGKKHFKQTETILKNSSTANSYADCDQDVIML